jgi:V/A-type H+/Na+-transporting ATPase subunit E
MPEDLQLLIDRLQREAVDEGQRRARTIVEEAEAKAAALVREAEAKAERLLERAAHDAEAFTERSTFALEQAGRDLLIVVSQSVERLLGSLVHESLMEELRPGLLAEMLAKMADAYAARGGRERRMQVLLGEDDVEELVRLYAQRYRDRVREGVELKLDNSVVKGFRLAMVDDHVEHDFTIDAIADALTHHLRPHLAKILPRSMPRVLRNGAAAPEAAPGQAPSSASADPAATAPNREPR